MTLCFVKRTWFCEIKKTRQVCGEEGLEEQCESPFARDTVCRGGVLINGPLQTDPYSMPWRICCTTGCRSRKKGPLECFSKTPEEFREQRRLICITTPVPIRLVIPARCSQKSVWKRQSPPPQSGSGKQDFKLRCCCVLLSWVFSVKISNVLLPFRASSPCCAAKLLICTDGKLTLAGKYPRQNDGSSDVFKYEGYFGNFDWLWRPSQEKKIQVIPCTKQDPLTCTPVADLLCFLPEVSAARDS